MCLIAVHVALSCVSLCHLRPPTAAQQRKRGLVVSAAELAPEAARADKAAGQVDPRARASRWFSQPLFDDVLADADAAAIQQSKDKKKSLKRRADDSESDDGNDFGERTGLRVAAVAEWCSLLLLLLCQHQT